MGPQNRILDNIDILSACYMSHFGPEQENATSYWSDCHELCYEYIEDLRNHDLRLSINLDF